MSTNCRVKNWCRDPVGLKRSVFKAGFFHTEQPWKQEEVYLCGVRLLPSSLTLVSILLISLWNSGARFLGSSPFIRHVWLKTNKAKLSRRRPESWTWMFKNRTSRPTKWRGHVGVLYAARGTKPGTCVTLARFQPVMKAGFNALVNECR